LTIQDASARSLSKSLSCRATASCPCWIDLKTRCRVVEWFAKPKSAANQNHPELKENLAHGLLPNSPVTFEVEYDST
jgi:hypothetical protein